MKSFNRNKNLFTAFLVHKISMVSGTLFDNYNSYFKTAITLLFLDRFMIFLSKKFINSPEVYINNKSQD